MQKTDGPKDAKASEEDGRFDDGAPGQTDAVHSQGAEQKEKPGSKRSGTMQEEGSDGPTNMGDARAEAKVRLLVLPPRNIHLEFFSLNDSLSGQECAEGGSAGRQEEEVERTLFARKGRSRGRTIMGQKGSRNFLLFRIFTLH